MPIGDCSGQLNQQTVSQAGLKLWQCHICSNLLRRLRCRAWGGPVERLFNTNKPLPNPKNDQAGCGKPGTMFLEIQTGTMACIGERVIISTREFAFLYSSIVLFWRDQIQGCQIKQSADLCLLHRVMSRPRGYLQGHTKELVWKWQRKSGVQQEAKLLNSAGHPHLPSSAKRAPHLINKRLTWGWVS